ncbi:Leucine rich repeat domain containing protein [Echinococcus multilocularis]|uniref:Leucine rich repeat domain containing protein n=1 Tax=Echinococcus multilocularis TaxID=6211 RepID=A0A068Y3D2_ECHMU|nr:Leucine rich repeat domain containing protein [Echinococcus multilocularis]
MLWVLLQEARATCRIEGTSCFCVEESTSQDDSLSNILAYCCQSDIFHLHINGSQIIGGKAFYQKPCHNLIDFRIHAPSQTSLAPDGMAFNGLPNLETLHITGDSTLSMLPKSVFSGLVASLRQLNLSNNALSSLSGSEFIGFADPNSRLDEVDLSNNRLQNLRAGCFQSLKGIRSLNLARNSISELRSDMFVGLQLLEELDLRQNPITVIIGGTFQPLTKLRKLLISGLGPRSSPLTTLTPGMLYGLQALRHLEISNLGIANINVETFMELRHLQELDLSGNQLTDVPHIAFKRMMLAQRGSRFQHLNLSNNRIVCLPKGGFSDFHQLKSLDLSGNLLTVISDQAFSGVKHLRDLDLLENPLLVIIPSAFDEFATADENGVQDIVNILHRHRLVGELLPKMTVVRIPNDDNIVGINKLRLRAVYGHRDSITDTTIAPFIDLSCPRLPLSNHISLKRSTNNVEAVSSTDDNGIKGFSGFLTQNKISLITIVVCAMLTLVVISATILSCQTCRKRRGRRSKTNPSEGVNTSPSLVEARKLHYPTLSKQNAFSYNNLEVGSTVFNEQVPSVIEKMSTSERLFNLGQQLAPPPYPHNLQTMEERLRQAVAASTTLPCLFNGYATSRESPRHPSSGQSSPSNLGSSPRFSSSTSSVQQQQQRQKVPPPLHLIMTTSAIDHEKSPPPPPSSVSPLHESGIASDNASSSLMTALGVF